MGTRFLTENLFQDNRDDVEYLASPEGKRAIVKLHADGVEAFITAKQKTT